MTHFSAFELQYKTEWHSGRAMLRRCYTKNDKSYGVYGGRGITVCDRWRFGQDGVTAFRCFVADMGERPSISHSLDRYPDTAGNYCPGNCRWATRQQQEHNKPNRGKSKYVGVYESGRRWKSTIQHNGQRKHLGTYATEQSAALAYDEASRAIHGANAAVNIPQRKGV